MSIGALNQRLAVIDFLLEPIRVFANKSDVFLNPQTPTKAAFRLYFVSSGNVVPFGAPEKVPSQQFQLTRTMFFSGAISGWLWHYD
jgi:hypothetical protein